MRVRHFHSLVGSALALLIAGNAWAQDAPDISKLADVVRWGGVALSLVVIAGSVIVLRLVSGVAARIGTRFAAKRLVVQKVESFIRFLLFIATAGICLGLSVRLDSTALTVIGGALAFAVGFAMRDLVAAFIAGITIMFDRPFQVGDRVAYAGEYGDIIKIGLRSVQMNTLDHNVVTIPNNKILTDVTASGNYGALEMQVAMDFYIGVDQDVKLAREIVLEACLTSRYVFLDREVPILTRQMLLQEVVAIHIKARPYVLDTKYEKAFETDVHLRVIEAFLTHGIRPPAILYRRVEDATPPTAPPRATAGSIPRVHTTEPRR
jgi:small-conductance mechanosensitive channel